jgi:hypothetical protein
MLAKRLHKNVEWRPHELPTSSSTTQANSVLSPAEGDVRLLHSRFAKSDSECLKTTLLGMLSPHASFLTPQRQYTSAPHPLC